MPYKATEWDNAIMLHYMLIKMTFTTKHLILFWPTFNKETAAFALALLLFLIKWDSS